MGRDKGVKLEVTRKNTTVRKVPMISIATPYDQKLKKHETQTPVVQQALNRRRWSNLF
jgi:hypothetical protein